MIAAVSGNNEALCIVLDGSTTAADSGALARQVARDMVDWYVASDRAMTAETLIAQLRRVHGIVTRQHRRASASYMIVHIRNDAVLALHAGGCLLGRRDAHGEPAWLTQPHTLANATSEVPVVSIADLPARHLLTRSLRTREFLDPDVLETRLEPEIIMATDGFWADLPPWA